MSIVITRLTCIAFLISSMMITGCGGDASGSIAGGTAEEQAQLKAQSEAAQAEYAKSMSESYGR